MEKTAVVPAQATQREATQREESAILQDSAEVLVLVGLFGGVVVQVKSVRQYRLRQLSLSGCWQHSPRAQLTAKRRKQRPSSACCIIPTSSDYRL